MTSLFIGPVVTIDVLIVPHANEHTHKFIIDSIVREMLSAKIVFNIRSIVSLKC